MYSQWQAAWRGALTCGVVLLALTCILSWDVIRIGAPPVPLLGAAILMAGIATLAMTIAFWCALFLADFRSPGRSFVFTAAAVSLGFILLLMLLPPAKPAVVVHASLPPAPDQLPGQSHHMALMVPRNPIEAILLPYFSLPVIAAFAVARLLRGRANFG